jgi:hypothetical protein
MTMLPANKDYVVVAVKDTNQDLHYDPVDDWWGYYDVDGGPGVVFARPSAGTKEEIEGYNASVVIQLRPPVGS